MRVRLSLVAILAMLLAAALAGLGGGYAAPTVPFKRADSRPSATPVDVELVLAVDISYSMDPEEQALQREGYIAALTSREFMQALKQGINAKVAITYFEWAGTHHQQIIVPWRLIDGPESADSFAADIARAKYTRAARTSISAALAFAMPLFDGSGYRGLRRVIDVSGDGVNNNGPPVTLVRDEVLAKGITINGLPIMLKRPNLGGMDIESLDVYFEDCVIGGPGAFVIGIREREKFKEAIRTKLLLEIAGLPARSRAYSAEAAASAAKAGSGFASAKAGRTPERRIVPASADKPRVSCTIGERLWQQRWGN